MYADNTKINTWTTSRGSTYTNYTSNYALSDGETVSFKLASLPSIYVIGLVNGNSYFQLQKVDNSNTARIYVNGVSSSDYSHTFSANDVIQFERVSSTQQKVYINDNLIHTASNHSFSNPLVMVRKYDNVGYTVDYVKIKPL